MRPTVVLFDVDGTLISCRGAGARAMRLALKELIGRDDVLDFPFGGGTDRGITRRALRAAEVEDDDATIDSFLARYLEHLPSAVETSIGYTVHPGVEALLDRLEGRADLAVGLGTGNVETGARVKLSRGNLAHRFAFGGFGDDHEERPRLIEAGARRGAARLGRAREECRVVIIGDTIKDVEAALAIGGECIAVATGGEAPQELLRHGARAVLSDLRDSAIDTFLAPQ